MSTPRPIKGVLLNETCRECGNRLWGLAFDTSDSKGDPMTLSTSINVSICGRCDRPAEPGMVPRRVNAAGQPIPEPVKAWYDRTAFLAILLILPVVAFVGWLAGVIVRALAGG